MQDPERKSRDYCSFLFARNRYRANYVPLWLELLYLNPESYGISSKMKGLFDKRALWLNKHPESHQFPL